MAKYAAAFKEEVLRLSAKSIRIETATLRRVSIRQSRLIAALRREIEALKRQTSPLRRGPKRAGPPIAATPQTSGRSKTRFQARGLVSLRKRLGLSQADLGKLIGCSGNSVFNWESGKAKPQQRQIDTLASIRGIGKREALRRLEAAT